IHSSGNDLLKLINDILDLAKIESGTVTVEVGDLTFADLEEYVERTFRPVAESKALDLAITLDPKLPKALRTDSKRLQQILRNLLSNAFKFTERGRVALDIAPAHEGWSPDHYVLTARSRWSRSASRTPASASSPRSSRSSSRRSSRPTARPAAATAARVWGSPSAARSRACSAVSSRSRAGRARAARSGSSCRRPSCRNARRAGSRPTAATACRSRSSG